MHEPCGCTGDYPHCPAYVVDVTIRQHQFLRGTSGLPREREDAYVSRILGEVPDAMPGPAARAWIFASALLRHAANGGRMATGGEYELRMTACSGCDRLADGTACLECGCPVAEKAAWASESCPLGKWGPAEGPTGGGCGGCGARTA